VTHHLLLILLFLADPKPSGLFHASGVRGEDVVGKDEEIPADVREKLNTIEGWGKLATTANSQTNRVAAATTLAYIGLYNKGNKLSREELADLRKHAAALCKSKDEQVRFFAVNTLGYVGNETTTAPLIELLKDKNPFMRLAVAEALEDSADDSCIEPLLATLKLRQSQLPLGFDVQKLTTCALTAVANIGSDKAKKALDRLESSTREPALKEAIGLAQDRWQAIQKPK